MSFDEPDEREEGELKNEPKKGRHKKQHVGEMEMPVSMVFKFLQLNPKRFGASIFCLKFNYHWTVAKINMKTRTILLINFIIIFKTCNFSASNILFTLEKHKYTKWCEIDTENHSSKFTCLLLRVKRRNRSLFVPFACWDKEMLFIKSMHFFLKLEPLAFDWILSVVLNILSTCSCR